MYRTYLVQFFKFLLFLSLGLGILYLVYRKQSNAFQNDCATKGIPLENCSLAQKVMDDFGSANYFWIAMVLLVFVLSNVSRSLRLNMLLRQLGARPRLINTFLTTILGYLANLGLPRVGEVVRAASLAQYEKIPVEKVMGTIVADRIMDVVCILVVTGLALTLEAGPLWGFLKNLGDKMGGAGTVLLLLGGGAAVFAALAYLFRKPLGRSGLALRIKSLAIGFWQGINTVRSLDRPGLFIFHTVSIWVAYFLITYLCFLAFGPTAHLSWRAALTVFVFGAWGVTAPSPGGMGTFHFMAQTALAIYGVSGEDGFSWANISFFSVNIGCNVIVGLAALVLLPIINRNYRPTPITV